jgi:hypothetical protein
MNEKNIQTVAMEEIWKSHTDGYVPVLMEIYNPDIKWEDGSLDQENMYLRVINDSNPVVYKTKKYIPCNFEFTPPEEDGKKIGQSTITISAIDSRVMQMLRSIEIPSKVRVVAAFAKNKNVYQFYPLSEIETSMSSASYNRVTAQFNLVFKDVSSLNVPRDIATKDILPSVDASA